MGEGHQDVQRFFDQHKIIHLRSLPSVPQHNSSCENAVGEIKKLVHSGTNLSDACNILNLCRKRKQLKWRTSIEVDKENPIPYNHEVRNEFYQAATLAQSQAMLGMKSVYEKRKQKRKAILATLERFGFITITRGNQLNARNR